ncbi:MAG: leucine-rich repeat domain-containing protein [Bacteroidales bacterium]|nr:leucine-rich repeat domain-containing protein [Bacteroidales bacterium]
MKSSVLFLLLLAATTMATAQTSWVISPSGHRLNISFDEANAYIIGQDTTLSGSIILPNSAQYWEYLSYPDIDEPYDSVLHTVPVTVVMGGAFAHCSRITAVAIPATVTHIGDGAFAYCSRLDSLTVASPNPIYTSTLGADAIIEPRTQTLVCGTRRTVIPPTVKIIGPKAFQGISGLQAITLPDSLESIQQYAFDGCLSLRALRIPQKVKHIGYMSLAHCPALTELVVDPANTVYDSRDNCNAVILSASHWLQAACPATVIPYGIKRIDQKAFVDITSLTHIDLPNTLFEITEFAFEGCTGLTSIHIPSSVVYIAIWGNPFARCTGLETITVDSANRHFDSRSSCNAIIEKNDKILISGCRTTVIPDNTFHIAPYAFQGMTGLHRIVLPRNTLSIGEGAFEGCLDVTTIISADEAAPTVSPNTFKGIDPNIPIHIHRGSRESYGQKWTYFHNFVEDYPVGIDGTAPAPKPYTLTWVDGQLLLTTSTPLPISLYDLSGHLLLRAPATASNPLNLSFQNGSLPKVLLLQVGNLPAEKILLP